MDDPNATIDVQLFIVDMFYEAIKQMDNTPETRKREELLRKRYDEERFKLYRLQDSSTTRKEKETDG